MKHHSVRDRARTGLAVIGAAAVLVAGVGAVAQAANGDFLKLGGKNKATKSTSLTNKKAAPALKLKSKSGPALSVNTTDLIANLNADTTDGKGLDELEPTTYSASLGATGQSGSATPFAIQTTTLPSGVYEFNIRGFINQSAGDSNQCVILDLTRYLASGATDVGAIMAVGEANQDVDASLVSHGIGTVIAGNRLVFYCIIDTSSSFYAPTQFTVKKVDRSGAIPGIAPTTVPKGTAEKLAR